MSTQVKEHPIIFSTDMIRAILNGSKTQSRRVIKPQPIQVFFEQGQIEAIWDDKHGRNYCNDLLAHCPYRQVGDRLWLKETFVIESDLEYGSDILPADRPIKTIPDDGAWGEYHLIPHYRATEPEPMICDDEWGTRWRPSMLMPRWASRITLENGERMEVLQAPAYTADDYNPKWAKVAPKWNNYKIILPEDLIWHWDWDFKRI